MTDMVNLDLSTIGDLNAECVALIPSLIKSLYDGKCKSKLNITIEFKRMEDSETAVVVGYSVKPKCCAAPTSRGTSGPSSPRAGKYPYCNP